MKKILFYLPFIKLGGIETLSIQYLKGLIDNGYKVDLLIDFNMGKEGNTFEYAIPNEINYRYVKTENVSKFIYFFRTIGKKNKIFNIFLYGFQIITDFYYYHTKVKKILKQEEYGFTLSGYQFLPSYITSFKNAKHIIWLHGSVEHFFNGITKIFKNSYGNKLQKYDYVITTAHEMKEQLIDFYPELNKNKIKMIYNPLDLKSIKQLSIEKNKLSIDEQVLIQDKYICTVSRLDENQKDTTTLILAYEKLFHENKINHKLYIIGDGPDKEFLTKLVNEKNLTNQIIFLGKKTNPFIWMKNAEVFILSSKFEGFGLVIVEAMTVETFAISSNCKTGPKEILQDGKCGDLFEIGNIDELTTKLSYVLSNDEYKYRKIKLASDRIAEFDRINIMKELNKLLA